ncbi:MAG: hypothetical protein EA397_19570 [Deltaproteobacteria bacterium]|nr:MAG: hypothetical protein EA397_19570 [Deltaproteobacteria bacterium]
MKWEIAENCRADIVGYSGINYSGDRFEARIFPSGRQGDDLPGDKIRSMTVVAPVGMRVVLRTSLQSDWEENHTWRCIRILEGQTFETNDGREAVRIPDLDCLHAPDAWRTNPDIEESYPLVKKLSDGKTWTFGRRGPEELKRGIVLIAVDKDPIAED